MGKQKGKNAFFFYLIHTQKEMEREGKRVGISDRELQTRADSRWKEMDSQQRQPFEAKARADKQRSKGQPIAVVPRNYNERNADKVGRVSSQMSLEMEDECDREEYYDKLIECCVKACKTKEELMNASFFIIGSNVMTHIEASETTPEEWIPLEIGITQYSIAKGIQFTYHEFIEAGGVPIGYMHSAKSWADDSHRIPLENFIHASNNYQKIVEDMIQILDNSKFTNEVTASPTPMLVFCREESILQNRGVLKWLAKKYQSVVPGFEWDLEVLDLVNLLFYVSKSQDQLITPAIGEDILSSSAFDYSLHSNCPYHEREDNRHCAQGLAKRLCYMLSGVFGKMFDIKLTTNHLPPNRENVVTSTYVATLHEVKTAPAHRYQPFADRDWEPESNPKPEASSSAQTSRPTGIGRGRGVPKPSPLPQRR